MPARARANPATKPRPLWISLLAASAVTFLIAACDEAPAPKKPETRKLPPSEDMFDIKEPAKAEPPPPPSARLAVSATALDFGRAYVGGRTERALTLRNEGGQPLALADVGVAGSGVFALAPESRACAPGTLAPGATCTVRFAFAPDREGADQGEALIAYSGGVERVRLSGLGAVLAPPRPERDRLLEAARALELRRLRGEPEVIEPEPPPAQVHTFTEYGMQDPDYRRIGIKKQSLTYPVDRTRAITEDRYIPAVLENAVNSQLPGRVIAVVEKHVYGSDGRKVLIPAGSRFVGVYQTLAKTGDTRLNVIWERILRPDGASILVEFEGADQMGRTGLVGEVDNRLWEKYGTALLVSTLSALTAFAVPSDTSTTSQSLSTAQADLSQNLAQITASAIQQNVNLAPVMTVAAGSRIEIIPTSDVWFREPTRTERTVSGGKVVAVASGTPQTPEEPPAAAERPSKSIRKQAQQPPTFGPGLSKGPPGALAPPKAPAPVKR